jgi:hypothetical protein
MWYDLPNFLAGIVVVMLGAYAGALADRFSYWFHVSRSLLWKKHCPECFSAQAWITAIPVCGYVLQKGVCSSCRALLPLQPIVTELIGAVTAWGLYAAVFWSMPPTSMVEWIHAVCLLVALTGMLVLAISDLVYDEVPLSAYVITAATLIFSLFVNDGYGAVLAGAQASLLAGILMYLLVFVSNRTWVHAHDVLLGMIVGFIVGWPGILITLAFAYIFAVIGGILQWGFNIKVYKGVSSFGLYLFIALALQGFFSAVSV